MVSEEIELNPALEAAGLQVVETDLGEYIIQLAGQRPSHITAPAIHMRKEDVSAVFEKHLGMQPTDDPKKMTELARGKLRQVFLSAGMGISGVNFAVAETGTLALVTNEGNGRMVTSLPPVHVALMGLERVVPTLPDLEVLLRVLARSSTGQKLSAYTTLLTGPRRPRRPSAQGDGGDEPDGPGELHLVIVDNGRSQALGGELSETLLCIRCGACQNVCPVYRQIGGHAYGSVIAGPIGAVLTPAMYGAPEWGELAETLLCIRCGACQNVCPVYREIGGHAYGSVIAGPIGAILTPAMYGSKEWGELAGLSSLCGACQQVCPVKIDIPTMLLTVRAQHIAATGGPAWMRFGLKGWALAMKSVRRYRWGQRLAHWGTRLIARDGRVKRLPGPLAAWTRSRDFPVFAATPFRERWAKRQSHHEDTKALRH